MSRAGNGNGAYTERHKLFCQMKLKTKPLECPHDEISWAGLLKMKNAKRSVNNKSCSFTFSLWHQDVYRLKKSVFERTEMFKKNLQELDVKHMLGKNKNTLQLLQIKTSGYVLKLNSNTRQLWVIKASKVWNLKKIMMFDPTVFPS